MTDTHRLNRFRGYFHTGEIPIARPDCLDADTVAALADGTLEDPARSEVLSHMAGCAFCRRAVASVAEAIADEPVTHEIEVVEGRPQVSRRSRALWVAVPIAAAATVVLLLGSPGRNGVPHRGGTGVAPTPIDPRGTVESVSQLLWTSVRGSYRYRVTLFGTQGNVLYETEIADTVVALPNSMQLVSGQTYLWKVEARTGRDRWLTSELVDFVIARARPQ